MTITSIGSSFSYIRPEAAARETAAAAASAESNTSTTSAGSGATTSPQASGSARPSVADELRALMIETQERHSSPSAPHVAARAYGGR